jgi:hypothetical protein
MLEQNRFLPPASSPAGVPPAPAVFDWQAAVLAGAFACPEDYDSTGILAGVDPFESRYWWMPELYTSDSIAGESTVTSPLGGAAVAAASGPSNGQNSQERPLKTGQAARRPGSRSPAAA